jgi:hypothetical protein
MGRQGSSVNTPPKAWDEARLADARLAHHGYDLTYLALMRSTT